MRIALTIFFWLLAVSAEAQSLAPMRKDIVSFADRFAIRLTANNPYRDPISSEFKVYEEDWTPAKGVRVTPDRAYLSAKGHTPIFIVGDFEGDLARTILICHETIIPNFVAHQKLRGQVCGRYRAQQLQLSQ